MPSIETLPEKTGYIFGGYYDAVDTSTGEVSGTQYYNASGASAHVWDKTDVATLYAKWIPVTYTVTYDANTPSTTSNTVGNMPSPSSVTKTYNTAIDISGTKPTLTGYTFTGWNTASDGSGTAYAASASMSTDHANTSGAEVKLYAQWTAIGYTVSFNGNGATGTTAQPNGGTMSNQSFNYDEEKALTANAYERKYTVTYNYNYTGSAATTDTSSYSFNGWNTSSDGTGTGYTDEQSVKNLLSAAGDYPLYAQWTSASVTLPTPTRNGYTFDGWYLNSGCTGTSYAGGDSYTPTDDITFFAKWSLVSYTITYKDSHNPTYSSTQNYNIESTDVLSSLSEEGYDFAGWDVQLEELTTPSNWSSTANHFDAGYAVTGMYGNVTLNGVWTAHTYTVTYNANTPSSTSGTVNMNGLSSFTKTYGTPETVSSTVPALTGYIFGGWAKTANGSKVYDPSSTFDDTLYPGKGGNVDLFAIWKPITYKIVFNGNSSEVTGSMARQTKTYDTSLTLNENNFRLTGYTFRGWSTTSGGEKEYDDEATLTTDLSTTNDATVTLYAVWEPNGYWVRFNGNGSTSGTMDDQRFTYDTPQDLTVNAFKKKYTVTFNYNNATVKNGDDTAVSEYTFTGWNTQTDGNGISYSNSQNVINLTYEVDAIYNVYAQWSDSSAGITLPVPTRTGYTFEGWYNNSDFTGSAITSPYIASEDITLYAKWNPRPYYITYHYNAPDAPESQRTETVYYDTDFTFAPKDYFGYLMGYEIGGWAETSDGAMKYESGSSSRSYVPSNLATGEPGNTDVDLWAVWTKKQYTANIVIPQNAGYALISGEQASKTITFNGSVTFTVELDSAHSQASAAALAAAITAGYGSVTAVKDSSTNRVTFTVYDYGESDVTVTTAAAPLNTYTVTLTDYEGDNFNSAVNGYDKPTVAATITHGQNITFTVTFGTGYDASGSVLQSVTQSGTDITASATVTPGTGAYTYTVSNVQGDIEISLKNAEKNRSTLKINAAGGTLTVDGTNVSGSSDVSFERAAGTVLAIPAPTRTGYVFAGWNVSGVTYGAFTQATSGHNYTFGSSASVVDTVVATWTPASYTVTLDQSLASAPAWATLTAGTASVTATYLAALPAIPVLPSRVGYDFKGYKDGSGTLYYDETGAAVLDSYELTENVTLYAQWDKHVYTVTYDTPVGFSVSVSNQSPYYDDSYTVTITAQTGYNINSVNVNVTGSSSFTKSVSGSTMTVSVSGVRGDNHVSLTGSLLTYTITTSADNSDAFTDLPEIKTVNYGTTGASVEVTVDDGYTASAPTVTISPALNYTVALKSGTTNTYVITISDAITENVTLTLSAVPTTYNATLVLPTESDVGYTLNDANNVKSIVYRDHVEYTLTLAAGYTQTLANEISVIDNLNGYAVLTKSENTVTVKVYSTNPGDVVITLGKARLNVYSVSFTSSNVGYDISAVPPSVVTHGENVTFSITLDEGYTSSAAPAATVTVGGNAASAAVSGSYTYTVTGCTGDVVITLGDASRNTSTLTLNLNGGTLTGSESSYTGSYGDTLSFGIPAKTGYTFSGWTLNSGAKGSVSSAADKTATYTFGSVQGAGDTLSANWTPNTYTVTFDYNDESGRTTDKTATYNAVWPTIANPERAGYDFGGWYTLAENGTEVNLSQTYTLTENTTVYAHWNIHQGTLIVDPAGGTVTINGTDYTTENKFSATSPFGTTLTVPAPVRTGYTFTGYARTNENGSFVNGVYTYGSVNGYTDTLTAQWEKNAYTIVYHFNVSGVSTTTSQTVYYATEFSLLGSGTFNRTGYTLTGWNSNAAGSGRGFALSEAVNENLCTGETGSTVYDLYAVWQINSSVAEFDPAGGTLTVSGTSYTTSNTYKPLGTYGETVNIPDPVKTGYDFTGWTRVSGSTVNGSLENGVYTFGAQASVEASDRFTANWSAKTFTVTYEKNDGTGESAVRTATYDANWPDAPTFTRTGWTFTGWYTTDACTTTATVSGIYNLTSGMTVYAGWTKNSNTVKFDPMGGSLTVGSSVYDHDSPYSVTDTYEATLRIADPARAGYTFSGWQRSSVSTSNGTLEGSTYTFGSTVNKTDVYEAQWTANTYTITYYQNDGTSASVTERVTYGEDWPTAPAFTRTGYTFAGWYTASEGGSSVDVSTGKYTNVGDTAVYAHWTAISYTIKYISNGSTTTAQYNIESAGTISVPTARTGYTFIGWEATEVADIASWTLNSIYNGTALKDQYGDVTFTAQWTKNTYTVRYNYNVAGAGVGAITQSATYDENVTLLGIGNSFDRTGYTLTGWTTADGSVTYNESATLTKPNFVSENGGVFDLYAVWQIHSSTLTVNPNGGTVTVGTNAITASTDFTENYGTVYEIVPSRTGYTFTGWTNGVTNGIFATTSGGYSYAFGAANGVTDTLTANWTINKLDVTLITGFGYTITDQTQSPVDYGTGYSVTISLSEGYHGVPTANVNNGSVTVTENANGTITYTVDNITEAKTVNIGSAERNYYTVTLTKAPDADGIDDFFLDGSVNVTTYQIEHADGTVRATVELKSNYSESDAPAIDLVSGTGPAYITNGMKTVVDGTTVYTYIIYNVTGDSTFVIQNAFKNRYVVSLHDTRVGYTIYTMPQSPVDYNEDSSVTILLSEAYSGSGIPAYSVKVNGVEYSDAAHITAVRDASNSKKITYTAHNITANTEINIGNATINTYTVDINDTGAGYTVSTNPDPTVNHGGSVSFTVTLDEAYSYSSVPAITATNAGSAIGYKDGNVITYVVTDIQGNCTINIADADKNSYTVTVYPGVGVTIRNAASPFNAYSYGQQFTVDHGDVFEFTVDQTGASTPVIYANNIALTPVNGKYTVVVTSNVNITTDNVMYTAIFVDYDNSIIASYVVPSGGSAYYNEAIPTRERTDHHVYVFSGWECITPSREWTLEQSMQNMTENSRPANNKRQ